MVESPLIFKESLASWDNPLGQSGSSGLSDNFSTDRSRNNSEWIPKPKHTENRQMTSVDGLGIGNWGTGGLGTGDSDEVDDQLPAPWSWWWSAVNDNSILFCFSVCMRRWIGIRQTGLPTACLRAGFCKCICICIREHPYLCIFVEDARMQSAVCLHSIHKNKERSSSYVQ